MDLKPDAEKMQWALLCVGWATTLSPRNLLFSPRASPPIGSAAGTMPAVELLQFLPMVPPLTPGASARELLQVPNGQMSEPVWVAEAGALALLDRGQQMLWTSPTAPLLQLATASAHAPLGTAALASSSSGGLTLCAIDDGATQPSYEPLPLEGAAAIQAGASFMCHVSDGRLLVGVADTLVCLSASTPPSTLLLGTGAVVSACVSSDEKTLYLCTSSAVSRCALDLDAGRCGAPEPLPQLPTEELSAVLADSDGNLYVGTREGVIVLDEQGESILRVSTPRMPTGLCFGGTSNSELIITAADRVWSLKTNSRGVQPVSAEFLKRIRAAGEGFRHEGW